MSKIVKFIKEVKIELIKVTWPKREELVGSTVVVLILSIILSIFLWVADTFIRRVVLFFLAK